MPPKGKRKVLKQVIEEINKPDPVEEKITELVKQDESICNHQNKHYTAGELLCTLPKGHGGDHVGYIGSNITAWSDAAGVPIKKHA